MSRRPVRKRSTKRKKSRRRAPAAARSPKRLRHARSPALRWNPDPEDVQRSVVQLVLSLMEFIRKLMERQAIRRLDANTLTAEEVENVGRALMKLEETIYEIARRFKLDPKDLNLDLGPLGRLH